MAEIKFVFANNPVRVPFGYHTELDSGIRFIWSERAYDGILFFVDELIRTYDGRIELPDLINAASVYEIVLGTEAVGDDGSVMTGVLDTTAVYYNGSPVLYINKVSETDGVILVSPDLSGLGNATPEVMPIEYTFSSMHGIGMRGRQTELPDLEDAADESHIVTGKESVGANGDPIIGILDIGHVYLGDTPIAVSTVDDGEEISLCMTDISCFGTAIQSDVRAGTVFSSQYGIGLVGTREFYEFYVDATSYGGPLFCCECDPDMTWREFESSSYNIYGFYVGSAWAEVVLLDGGYFYIVESDGNVDKSIENGKTYSVGYFSP